MTFALPLSTVLVPRSWIGRPAGGGGLDPPRIEEPKSGLEEGLATLPVLTGVLPTLLEGSDLSTHASIRALTSSAATRAHGHIRFGASEPCLCTALRVGILSWWRSRSTFLRASR